MYETLVASLCNVSEYDSGYAKLMYDAADAIEALSKMEKATKPHGRLIDADALKASLVFAEKTANWAVPALRAVLMVIDEMPTIIEAEEEGMK